MPRSSKLKTLGLGAAVLVASTLAGIAYAANERYDDAKANIEKAVALLKAIENPNERAAEKNHRQHAIQKLEGALEQIAKAKEVADRPPKPAPTPAPAPAPAPAP